MIKMLNYYDENLDLCTSDKAVYSIDFNNKSIELLKHNDNAYPIISFDEILQLQNFIDKWIDEQDAKSDLIRKYGND